MAGFGYFLQFRKNESVNDAWVTAPALNLIIDFCNF